MNRMLFREYINKRMKAVKINSNKVPLDRWKEAECAEYEENALYAFVIPKGMLIIDVDVKNNQPGLESFERFKGHTYIESITHNVTTGSGGYHYYCRFPSDLPLLNAYACKQVYPGIDFLQAGQLVIGAEQTLDNGEYILNPSKGLNLNYGIDYKSNSNLVFKGDITFYKSFGKTIGSDLSDLTSSIDYSNISLEQIKACLDLVDSSDYFLWIKVGMALYQQLGDWGFPLFVEWSKKSDKFKSEHEAMTKWKSFNQKDPSIENAVTFGTLHYHALETKLNNLVLEIKQCKDKDSVKKVLRNEKYTSYPKFKNEHILNVIPKYLKKLDFFDKYTPSQLRDLCMDGLKTEEDVSHETSRKEELNELIFNKYIRLVPVLSKNCYIDINTEEYLDSKDIEAEIKPYKQELNELYNVKNFTVDIANSEGLIKKARIIDYNPSKKERVYKDEDGKTVFNKYNYKTVPPLIPTMTPEGERFKKVLLDAEVLLGKQNLEILININRYFIEHPGKKLDWVLVIKGFQGAGKNSLIDAFLKISVGKPNFRDVSADELLEKNTGWAAETQVITVSELKIDKKAYNRLKTYITEENARIVEKYFSTFSIPNRFNFIFATNFEDCIPLESDDRRYAIVFCKARNKPELDSLLKQRGYAGRKEYFALLKQLSNSSHDILGQLRYFIFNYPYNDLFDPNEILFEIDNEKVKKVVLENDSTNEHILEFLHELFDSYHPDYIDFNYLYYEYEKRCSNTAKYGYFPVMSSYKLQKLITSFGYIKHRSWFYSNKLDPFEAEKYIDENKNFTTPAKLNKLDIKETSSLLTEIDSQKKSKAEKIKEILKGIKFRE